MIPTVFRLVHDRYCFLCSNVLIEFPICFIQIIEKRQNHPKVCSATAFLFSGRGYQFDILTHA
jgi:hypothetical protein